MAVRKPRVRSIGGDEEIELPKGESLFDEDSDYPRWGVQALAGCGLAWEVWACMEGVHASACGLSCQRDVGSLLADAKQSNLPKGRVQALG